MKFELGILLGAAAAAAAAAAAQSVPLVPYAQCGGLGWTGAYDCESGHSCRPVGTDAFPRYQCLPNTGPIIPHTFPYGQCGGLNFQGPFICAPGWSCVVANAYFSVFMENAGHSDASVSPTPNLAGPGSWCGATAIAGQAPADCVNGFTCSGPGVYGYYVCLRSQNSSTSGSAGTTTGPATFVTSGSVTSRISSTSK